MRYFYIVPVTQSHRQNHLFAFVCSQCLKRGNSTRKAVSTSLNRDTTELEKVLLAPAEILGERLVL